MQNDVRTEIAQQLRKLTLNHPWHHEKLSHYKKWTTQPSLPLEAFLECEWRPLTFNYLLLRTACVFSSTVWKLSEYKTVQHIYKKFKTVEKHQKLWQRFQSHTTKQKWFTEKCKSHLAGFLTWFKRAVSRWTQNKPQTQMLSRVDAESMRRRRERERLEAAFSFFSALREIRFHQHAESQLISHTQKPSFQKLV